MEQKTLDSVRRLVRTSLAVGIILLSASVFVVVLRDYPGNRGPGFDQWYGNWRGVILASILFPGFLLGFARPRRPAEWRNAGLYSAFLISLFTEMFGLPLTIYLIAPAIGVPARAFGLYESHLWGYLLSRTGLVTPGQGMYVVMVLSAAFIGVGASLVALGWQRVYWGRGELVTDGIYRHLRHPQYLGLILIVIGFNIQWPTIPTLIMGPILVAMYMRLAGKEDADLEKRFGAAFGDYRRSVNAFIPWPRPIAGSMREVEAGRAQSSS